MKKWRRTRTILAKIVTSFVLLGTFLFVESAFGQFEFPRLDQPDMFGEEKKISIAPASRYNRIEGLFLGAQVVFRPFPKLSLEFPLMGGYGFTSKAFHYVAEAQKNFFNFNRLTVGVGYFDETFTNDGWTISTTENSLAAMLLREDFYDYHGREGWRVYANQLFRGRHTARVVYSSYDYEDLGKADEFAGSIFGGNKEFRQNPYIIEGRENSLKLMLELDWRDSPLLPLQGWLLQTTYEKTMRDFDTDGLFVTLVRYQPTFGNQRFVARALFGARKGSLADQHLMDIGGLGTLRGFREKSQTGQNLMFASVNYFFGGDILQPLPLHFVPAYDQLSLGLFMDAGSAWAGTQHKSGLFDQIDDYCILADVGLSLLVAEGLVRLDFARQIKNGDGSWKVTMRLLSGF